LKTETSNNFQIYLNALTDLKTPLVLSTQNELGEISPDIDSLVYARYKHHGASRPYGLLFRNDSIVMTVDIIVGDILVPVITTFNQSGQKLDSLRLYQKAGWDLGLEADEFVTITSDKKIIITDSIRRWDLNAERDDIIEGTERLTVDMVIYQVGSDGKFLKTDSK
jgi:hypothetical protein